MVESHEFDFQLELGAIEAHVAPISRVKLPSRPLCSQACNGPRPSRSLSF